MAEWIERRRLELGLTPGGFVEASGLTQPGLAPVRRGARRAYQDKVILGVAEALRVRPDWYDRLLAGKKPIAAETTPGMTARVASIEERLNRVEERLERFLARLDDPEAD